MSHFQLALVDVVDCCLQDFRFAGLAGIGGRGAVGCGGEDVVEFGYLGVEVLAVAFLDEAVGLFGVGGFAFGLLR